MDKTLREILCLIDPLPQRWLHLSLYVSQFLMMRDKALIGGRLFSSLFVLTHHVLLLCIFLEIDRMVFSRQQIKTLAKRDMTRHVTGDMTRYSF